MTLRCWHAPRPNVVLRDVPTPRRSRAERQGLRLVTTDEREAVALAVDVVPAPVAAPLPARAIAIGLIVAAVAFALGAWCASVLRLWI